MRPARALAFVVACAAHAGAPLELPAQLQTGISMSADTVTVGSPFTVSVRVRAPLGDSLVFPPGPDTTGAVQALDPVSVRATGDTAAVDRTATYRLAAWDVGEQEVELGAVTVLTADGEREVRLPPRRVFVQSVLPADTALRIPKPARSLWEFPRPWWIPWLVGLLALLLLLLLLWWLLRRRRRAPAAPAAVDPYAEAEERFAGVEALGLVEGGERGRYVALVIEILRDYLAARVPGASPALTSRELLLALATRREVPHDRLAAVLHEGDLVKFARRPVSAERAREIGAQSRAVVSAVEHAMRAAAAPQGTDSGSSSRENAA
ncbi:MAG TPA: hypothetical protein VGE02_16435 [Gemmatimonadales bacterium]